MAYTGSISVVIPTYNGEKLLRDNLPSVIDALESWGGEYELIVVDDCSTDESCDFLATLPRVRVLVNPVNMGFAKSCNAGMFATRYPVCLCINNDVKATSDFIAPLLRHFNDPSVFAVTPNILVEREGRNQGIVTSLYGKGFIKGAFALLGETSAVRENLYAIGACVAYDMAKFRALGGFSEIYSPYLFEDVDISYRAWKRGWRSMYEPGATVFHYSSASIGRTRKRHKRRIYFRNRFLFHWINLTDTAFIARNILHTVMRLAVSFLWLDFPYYGAFIDALGRIGEVARLRRSMADETRVRDKDILHRTAKNGM
jgi:GT2 family glycosyltransferase